MRFVASKPSLPVGTSVDGFSTIKTALHVDPAYEVYLLEDTGTLLLLLIRITAEPSSAIEARLKRWWNRLGPEKLQIKRLSEHEASAGRFLQAVIEVNGMWIGTADKIAKEQKRVYAYITAVVELAYIGVGEHLRPDVRPSLLWQS